MLFVTIGSKQFQKLLSIKIPGFVHENSIFKESFPFLMYFIFYVECATVSTKEFAVTGQNILYTHQ